MIHVMKGGNLNIWMVKTFKKEFKCRIKMRKNLPISFHLI